MKTVRLRALIRKYGEFGVLLVALYLLLHHLWHHRRGLLAFLVVSLCLAYSWRTQPAYLPSSAPALPTEQTAPTTAYKLTDLGTLPGCTNSVPLSINSKGQIVGYAQHPQHGMHAFLWQKGKMTDLGNLGVQSSIAFSINAQGQVVGTSVTEARQAHGFLYRDGKLQDLGTLGGEFSRAHAINAKGQIVGIADADKGVYHAFLWQAGKMTDLGAPPGTYLCSANGINDRGEVAGGAGHDRAFGAFLYREGKFQKIVTLGGESNAAYTLNNKGQVVGLSEVDSRAGGPVHGFLWQNGKNRDLGTLGGSDSSAYAINDAGQVVGWAFTARREMHAFLWTNGKMTDLDKQVSRSGWRLVFATGINADGQIIGIGISDRKVHGFLLTPSR
jgi:probable HAF family extracellular repeat protein